VDPVEVEAVLRGTGEFVDVIVLGLPDAEWGQSIVAVYPETARPDLAKVAAAVSRLLAPAKRPKRFIPLAAWPANAQGKVNRAEIFRRVTAEAAGT
jgi:acyl-CoA synthetase (AMP-forming)/AMP-acid ligase II